jgi:hypothetical protein
MPGQTDCSLLIGHGDQNQANGIADKPKQAANKVIDTVDRDMRRIR